MKLTKLSTSELKEISGGNVFDPELAERVANYQSPFSSSTTSTTKPYTGKI